VRLSANNEQTLARALPARKTNLFARYENRVVRAILLLILEEMERRWRTGSRDRLAEQ
jgi:hypothetical protein